MGDDLEKSSSNEVTEVLINNFLVDSAALTTINDADAAQINDMQYKMLHGLES